MLFYILQRAFRTPVKAVIFVDNRRNAHSDACGNMEIFFLMITDFFNFLCNRRAKLIGPLFTTIFNQQHKFIAAKPYKDILWTYAAFQDIRYFR